MYNITFIIVSEQILFLAVVVSDVVCATIATDVELKELIKEYCCKHKCLFSFCIFSIGSLCCHNFFVNIFFMKLTQFEGREKA